MRELADLHQCCNVLLPIGAVNGDGPAVLTPASWREEEGRRLRDRNGSLIDGQPSGINRGSPLDVIKRRGGRRFFRLSSGIPDLKVEYGIRSGKRDGSHQLGQVTFWRWKKRGSAAGCAAEYTPSVIDRNCGTCAASENTAADA